MRDAFEEAKENIKQAVDATADFLKALLTGDMERVREALARGADVNARDEAGRTAFQASCDLGHFSMAAMLVDKGADFSKEQGSEMLHAAAALGAGDLCAALIVKGADPADTSENGMTPSEIAVDNGHDALASCLHGVVEARVEARKAEEALAKLRAPEPGKEAQVKIVDGKQVRLGASTRTMDDLIMGALEQSK
jgi:hypothetical protein